MNGRPHYGQDMDNLNIMFSVLTLSMQLLFSNTWWMTSLWIPNQFCSLLFWWHLDFLKKREGSCKTCLDDITKVAWYQTLCQVEEVCIPSTLCGILRLYNL